MAKVKSVDFTNVKDGGGFSKTHIKAGDYAAKVTKVADSPAKSDGVDQWLFTVQVVSKPSATYPYYCKLQENQLWKLRNLLIAAGINVPKKKVSVDPSKIVGKIIGISLDDTEYNDRMQSEITAVFPAADLEGNDSPADDDEDEEDVEEEEEVEEEEAEDEEEEEEPEPPKAKAKKKKKKVEEVDDSELEELDIEEL